MVQVNTRMHAGECRAISVSLLRAEPTQVRDENTIRIGEKPHVDIRFRDRAHLVATVGQWSGELGATGTDPLVGLALSLLVRTCAEPLPLLVSRIRGIAAEMDGVDDAAAAQYRQLADLVVEAATIHDAAAASLELRPVGLG